MKESAGLIMLRERDGQREVLIVHPGGPYYVNKNAGHWTLPKGLIEPGEDRLDAAKREFREETGFSPDAPHHYPIGSVKMKGGKTVHAWAFFGDCDPAQCRSNTFQLEWPPRSGRTREFPEIDRAIFCSCARARELLNPALLPLIDRVEHEDLR